MKKPVCKACGTRKHIEEKDYGYGKTTVALCPACGSWTSTGERERYIYVCDQESVGLSDRECVQDNATKRR